jgi:hypothetical protein
MDGQRPAELPKRPAIEPRLLMPLCNELRLLIVEWRAVCGSGTQTYEHMAWPVTVVP